MKIYDITQPLFGCRIYPGDPEPRRTLLHSMEGGDVYNMTELTVCVHNGTHVDAPRHFIRDGKGIGEISLERFIGPALVTDFDGELTAEDAQAMIDRFRAQQPGAGIKILLRGDALVSADAARAFAEAGTQLLGVESQSVGPVEAPMEVHLILLGAETVLLEGLMLQDVPEGFYLLNCAPLDLEGCDGSPCRAVLIGDAALPV